MDQIDLEANVPSNLLLKGIYDVAVQLLAATIANPSNGGQYQYYTDGTAIIRTGMRNSAWVRDITLTFLGFAGAQNVDWQCLEGE